MRKKVFIVSCSVVLLTSFFYSQVLALKEETHKAINMNIAERDINGFSIDTYLIHNLGLTDGYKQKLKGLNASGGSVTQSVSEWLGYGGEQEDRPGSTWDFIRNNPTRSVNHFHNPLKTNWDEAGLNDLWKTGQSSVLWAQNTNQTLGGNWSWQDTREYFYIALTGKNFAGTVQAPTQQDREKYFAKTFRGVGQLMHLVEDASVPEHVRNDAHILKAYEGYVLDFQTKQILWNDLLANPITFDKSTLNIASTHPSASVPISRIIDTDKYTGTNPNITTDKNCSITNSITCNINSDCPSGEICVSTIGLAEYTNANFFSGDTMFKENWPQTDPHYFPYPNKLSTNLQELISKNILPETVTTEDGVQQPTLYIKKEKDGEIIGHFVKPKYTTTSRLDYIGGKIYELDFYQDEAVYEEYAKLLLPRAVGYSAGLLNYFFRGDMNLEFNYDAGYGYVILNNINEEMEGMFEVYYDDVNNQRHRLWYGELFIRGNGKSSPISFTTPEFPKEPDKFILVFNGRIGSEYDAVAGKVVAMPGMNLIRAHFIVFRDRDSKIRDNLTGQYKYPASIDWPFAGPTYEESGDDRSGYYNTQSILMLTAETRAVPEDWGYVNNIQYYWKIQEVSGQAKLVQQGAEPGDRRLYHKTVINVDDHSFTVNRVERTTLGGLVTHSYDSSYSKPPYVYHTDDPLHDTYWNDGFDATAGLCDSSIIFMQAFWYQSGSSGNSIHIFGHPEEAYGGTIRNPEFTGDNTYNAFPGEIYLGNMTNPWFSRYITFDGNDVWRALSTDENHADFVELYSAHAPMYTPEPF